jgi:hypothetical protein
MVGIGPLGPLSDEAVRTPPTAAIASETTIRAGPETGSSLDAARDAIMNARVQPLSEIHFRLVVRLGQRLVSPRKSHVELFRFVCPLTLAD